MSILQHKILMSLNPDEINLLLDQLEAFGHRSLSCMSAILSLSNNSDTVRAANSSISRIKEQFEWLDQTTSLPS
jgi:hypothetical protein